jgi:hypothetical protein
MYSYSTLFSNIEGVIVLENVNLPEDKNRATADTDVDFCHQSVIYTGCSVYFNRTLISYEHGLSCV